MVPWRMTPRRWMFPCSYFSIPYGLVQREIYIDVMSQQPSYGQQSMGDTSWDLVNKTSPASALSTAAAAAAAAAVNAYNGYPRPNAYQLPAGGSNGSHYTVPARPAHLLQMSPTSNAPGTGGGNNNGTSNVVQQHWHGICLPTAPSTNSGTVASAAEQWLVATNHLQSHERPPHSSGMNSSPTMTTTPSSNAAVAAVAAAQLYSGNTTSYFSTGGGGEPHPPIVLPPARETAQGQTVLSPTSPTGPLAASWPHSRSNDSIFAKQHPPHHHHLHLPQSSEQPSPQQHHHHNVAMVHGLNEKTSPHFPQLHHQSRQKYSTFPSPGGSVADAAAVSSYGKLLEAVAIQAARVPFLNPQQQPQPPHYHHNESSTGVVTPAARVVTPNMLELDILRNLAATAGGSTGGGYVVAGKPPVSGIFSSAQSEHALNSGINGYSGSSSFRPPMTMSVKQEPSYCDITPPPQSTSSSMVMPASDLDVAHTMLSIQTCSLQNTVPEYQQISPVTETSQAEMKYQPPSSVAGRTDPPSSISSRNDPPSVSSRNDPPSVPNRTDPPSSIGTRVDLSASISTRADPASTSGTNTATRNENCVHEVERKAFAAITVEMSQNDTDDVSHHHVAKRLKISTTPDYAQDTENNHLMDSNHSEDNAQLGQAKNDDTTRKSPSPNGSISGKVEENSRPTTQSSSNDTPLSVGGRTDSENDSPASFGATATAVSVGGANITLSTVTAPYSASVPTEFTSSIPIASNPPTLLAQSPFGAFAAQHAGCANVHTCHICGFSSPSKFHFNSHMNTHANHRCTKCDYTSRTEGRLKRHMKEFHSPPQVSTSNSNDAPIQGGAGTAQFDQSLEEQLQAVVSSLKASTSSGGSGNRNASSSKPSTSSTNKLKTYRCKQCDFVAKSKDDSWAHARSHIKPDKLLACEHCPFVTEYKHHLEYHQRNHSGTKPFKCVKCNYSCVNKSMLNSHMKSHSNVFQFKCADCTYATKYCHSLKLHLRKYGHNAATTTAPDGATLVDGTAIDVYGNRRGPRNRKDNGNRSSAECPRTMVTPLSNTLSISSPSQLCHQSSDIVSTPPGFSGSTLIDTLNHQNPPTMVTSRPTNASPSNPMMPSFVEALQNSILAHQQKDLTAAMVTSIATLGAQLPTIPSLAAALAAAQNQSTPAAAARMIPSQDGSSPGPMMVPGSMMSSNLQITSPTSTIQGQQLIKCNLCDFSCTSKEILTKHTLIHMIEKPEQLYQVYSFMASAAVQAQAVAAAAAALATSSSQQSTSGSSSCGSTPVTSDTIMIRSDMAQLRSGAYGGQMEEQVGVSQDASHDSGGSPGSMCGEKASGDEGMANETFLNAAVSAAGGHRQRRKGRAFKLDRIALKLQGKGCEEEDDAASGTEAVSSGECENLEDNRTSIATRHTRSTSPVASCHNSQSGCRANRSESVSSLGRPNIQRGTSIELNSHSEKQDQDGLLSPSSAYPTPMGRPTNIDWSNAYVCNYCEIAFKDCIMYTMHMGFHGYQDPYKCNTCGHISDDPRSMFLHIAREPHL